MQEPNSIANLALTSSPSWCSVCLLTMVDDSCERPIACSNTPSIVRLTTVVHPNGFQVLGNHLNCELSIIRCSSFVLSNQAGQLIPAGLKDRSKFDLSRDLAPLSNNPLRAARSFVMFEKRLI
jgi:hypothetical protein